MDTQSEFLEDTLPTIWFCPCRLFRFSVPSPDTTLSWAVHHTSQLQAAIARCNTQSHDMGRSSTTFRLVVICLCKQALSDSVYTEPVLLHGSGWCWGVRSGRGVARKAAREVEQARLYAHARGRRGQAKPDSLSGVYKNLHPVIKQPIFGAV